MNRMMMEEHEPETRSYSMNQIRCKNTYPELQARKFLYAYGYGCRQHDEKLPSTPDTIFPKCNTMVLGHECVWHGHEGGKYYIVPKKQIQRRLDGINSNKFKDKKNESKLNALGWNVLTVFECKLKSEGYKETLFNLIKEIHNGHTRN